MSGEQAAPAAVGALLAQGERLFAAGAPAEAAALFEQALARAPRSADVHCNLGAVSWALGRLDRALAHFIHALELDPDHLESALNLARVRQVSGRIEEAQRGAREFLARHPEAAAMRELVAAFGERPAETTAGTASATARMRVVVFSAEPREWACARLRLTAPLAKLHRDVDLQWARRGGRHAMRFDSGVIEGADLIVLQRLFPGVETLELCRRIFDSGRPVIYELDDDFLHVPPSHPHAEAIREHEPFVLECLSRADAVTVSTPELGSRVAPYNRNVHVLPNALDTTVWCGTRKDSRPDSGRPIVIGFAGTPTHGPDLQIVTEALSRIQERYGDGVEFRFLGCAPPRRSGVKGRLLNFESRYSAYANALARSGIDIALAPLVDNEFNRCKSDIKWLEYAACGIPGIYSDLPVYRDSFRNGESGILVENSTEAWFEAIERLVRDPALRGRMGRAARAEVMAERTIDRVAPHYLEAYRGVLQPRERADAGDPPLVAEYELWKRRHTLTDARRRRWAGQASESGMRVHLVVVAHECEASQLSATLASLARQIAVPASTLVIGAGERAPEVAAQVPYRRVQPGLEPEVLRDIAGSCGDQDWLGVVEAGDVLAEEALAACLAYAGANPAWSALYSDEDFLGSGGVRTNPLFKPDCNPDLLRATPYTGHLWLARASVLTDATLPALPLAAFAHDIMLRVWERDGDGAVGHVPRVLYHRSLQNALRADTPANHEASRGALVEHLGRAGESATVEDGPYAGSWTVRYPRGSDPLVSIIVAAREGGAMLEDCVESVLGRSDYPNFELLVVYGGRAGPEGEAYLRALESRERVRVLRCARAGGTAALFNYGAGLAGGEVLLFLGGDTIVVQKDWVSRMLEHALRPQVGAVGVRLVRADRTVRNAGIVLGLSGTLDAVGQGDPLSAPGYMGRAQLDQDLSAVSGACLMMRADRFREVDGLDETHFGAMFGASDLCLRLGRAGYRILWTPRVTLIQHDAPSRDDVPDPQVLRAEVESLWTQWLPRLARDPSYHPQLSLAGTGWEVETEVDVPWESRLPGSRRVLGFGAGSEGVLRHRLTIPLHALDHSGRAQCALVPTRAGRARVPTLVELERSGADVVLLHNAVHDMQLDALRDYSRYSGVFRVFGQDDLMTALPEKNRLSQEVYRDIEARLRLALSHCDRLVVTTEPLARAYRHMIDDIRVVPNYLSRAVWGSLRSARRRGRKPRVGWAGAQQHAGDLEILREVVKQTAEEVDWVFFGMSLHEFRRYRKELHNAVSFEEYPRTLAGLDLDLAVAPLECNRFNEAKSSLRILEYGALGWPVVCTDIEPYRGAPVCRVPNRPRAWIEAIRERIRDLDAAATEGDRLRAWVHGGWMLEDHLEEWLGALQPGTATVRERAGNFK